MTVVGVGGLGGRSGRGSGTGRGKGSGKDSGRGRGGRQKCDVSTSVGDTERQSEWQTEDQQPSEWQ